MSLPSVGWDLRLFWALLPFVARVYLLVLVCTSFVTLCVAIKICRSLRNRAQDGALESVMARFRNTISHLRHSFALLLLAFGILVSDMVFQSARDLASFRHVDVDAAPPLDGPAGLGLIVFAAFFVLFCLLWYAKFKTHSVFASTN